MTTAVPPEAAIWDLAGGYLLSRCLHTAAELGIADALDGEPLAADAIAAAVSADADALHRMLRLLATRGVFAETAAGWTHTPTSELLRSDHPRSMRAFVRMIGSDYQWRSTEGLPDTARTGRPAMLGVCPEGPWEFYKSNPEHGRIFDQAMTAKAQAQLAPLLAAHDFSRYPVIADIGGGRGHILHAVIAASPGSEGILFDLPEVLAALAPPPPRVRLHPGSFFKSAPAADAYLLSNILHDWPDADCLRILRTLRAAAPPGAQLLVLEIPLSDAPGPHPAKLLDIVMLIANGGRERTIAQYAALLAGSGWRLDNTVPLAGPDSLLVASPA